MKFSVDWVLESFPLNEPDIVLATLWAPKTGFVHFWILQFILKAFLPSIFAAGVLAIVLCKLRKWMIPAALVVLLLLFVNVYDSIVFKYEVPISEYVTLLKSNKTKELSQSQFMQDEFFIPNIVSDPSEKRNLVLIFLESMEKNYGSFIPELTELSKKNLSFAFEGVGGLETFATTGTLNSTIAKVTGVPQLDLFHASYFPQVSSIYKLLGKRNYKNVFIRGTSNRFTYFDQFLKNTGIDVAYDISNFDGAINHSNGFDYVADKKLLSYSKEILDKLSKRNEPFSLSLFTVESHYPNGFYNEDCPDVPVDNSDSARYRAVLKCGSREVAEFVEWIKAQNIYDRTTIVLVGDHLFKGKSLAADDTYGKQRSWYNAFINVDSLKKETNPNRQFTSFDIAPTIIEALGYELDKHRMGLGVSLFSDSSKTIVEKIGLDSLNKELRQLKNTIEYQSLCNRRKSD